MNLALIAALAWFVLAHVLAFIPSKDRHWRRAYFLIALGIPILGWVTVQNGPIVALVIFAAGASVLRWPLIYLGRWMRRRING
jgi:hypothetical protein